VIEQLRREKLPVQPFTTSNASKAAVIEALTLAFERDDIQILRDPILLSELQAYQAETLPSGLLRYGAPSGQHDDTVMALAMAWHGVVSPRAEPRIRFFTDASPGLPYDGTRGFGNDPGSLDEMMYRLRGRWG
jgi:hypothetical protein